MLKKEYERKHKEDKPVVAICYDFDKTLSPDDMHPDSALLAQAIRESVIGWVQPHNTRELKRATDGIFLLHHTTAPAVLVECGFLSNPEEREKLKTSAYQQQMAFAVMAGYWNYQSQK